ncbi:hypothetical protein BDF19DRAFT_466137 [Syncephalis fuscata]|nr:hypothetical protein BDF19DRAFT_466137 [Syncephalis fuscata]
MSVPAHPTARDLKEPVRLLNDIKAGLSVHLSIGDWAGSLLYVSRLENYMDLKYPLEMSERVQLGQLLYTTLTQPEVDLTWSNRFANTLIRLISNDYRVPNHALQLEWRPLYYKLKQVWTPKSSDWTSIDTAVSIHSLKRLPLIVSRFFDLDTATDEMLGCWLPMLQPLDHGPSLIGMLWLGRFLPIEPRLDGGPPKWLPTLFQYWMEFARSIEWCDMALLTIGRLAKRHANYRYTDASNTGTFVPLFETRSLDWVYNLMLRHCAVPIAGQGKIQSNSTLYRLSNHQRGLVSAQQEEWFGLVGIWTTRTDEVDANGMPLGIQRLENWFKAFESYFHPSNQGSWSIKFAYQLKGAAQELLTRVRAERDDERYQIRPENRLTKEMIRRIVIAFRPALLLAMFSKDSAVVSVTHRTLSYLAWIDPEVIIPPILSRVVPSLESLTETHRTTSMIDCLARIARPLFCRSNYPQGGKYLGALLQLTLPGLDANDSKKCIATTRFIYNALCGIPLYEIKEAISLESYLWDGTVSESNDEPMDILIEDNYCRATTLDISEWAVQYLTRIIAVLESTSETIDHSGGGQQSTSTTNSSGLIAYNILITAEIFFAQLSPELYTTVYGQLIRHLREHSPPTVSYDMAALCQVAVAAYPATGLAPMLELCIDRIKEELAHGAGARDHSERSDMRLHWHQLLLAHILANAGPQVVVHKTALIAILRLMDIHCHSKKSIELYGEVLGKLLNNITSCRPIDVASESKATGDDPEYMNQHIHRWHTLDTMEGLKVRWHTANEAEISLAMNLLQEFTSPMIHRLESIARQLGQNTEEDRSLVDEAERLLKLVYSCVNGSNELVIDHQWTIDTQQQQQQQQVEGEGEGVAPMAIDVVTEQAMPISKMLHPWENERQLIEANYLITDRTSTHYKEYNQLHRQLLNTLHQLMQSLMTHRDYAVNCTKQLLSVINLVLIDRGCTANTYGSAVNRYNTIASMFVTPLDKKQRPRSALVERAAVYHLRRLKYNSNQLELLPEHRVLIDDLVACSTSAYSETRRKAQSVLYTALSSFFMLRSHVIKKLVDTLVDPNVSLAAMKGVYHTLKSHSLLLRLANRDQLARMATALLITQRESKPSIIRLTSDVFSKICMLQPARYRPLIANTDLRAQADLLVVNTTPLNPEWRVAAEKVAHLRLERALTNRVEIETAFIKLLASNELHATFQFVATSILHSLQHTDTVPSVAIAEIALKYMVSELPRLRISSGALVARILCLLKAYAWRIYPHPLKSTKILPRPLPDHFTELYIQHAFEEQSVDTWPLQDKEHIGIQIWPDQMTVYQFASTPLYPAFIPADAQPVYELLQSVLGQTSFWLRLSSYMTEEQDSPNANQFVQQTADVYKIAAQLFGIAILEAQLPILIELSHAYDQSHKQRALAEMLAGIIRGSKHWPRSDRDKMWQCTLPILQDVVDHMTPETLSQWDHCIYYALKNRDPRRVLPLIEWLTRSDHQFDPTSSSAFSQVKWITLLRRAAIDGAWTLRSRFATTLPHYLQSLNYPYHKVRTGLGYMIDALLQLQLPTPYTSVAARLLHDTQGLQRPLAVTVQETPTWMTELLTQLAQWRDEHDTLAAPGGSSNYTNATLLPEICRIQELSDRPDLQAQATNVLRHVISYPYPPDWTSKIVEQLTHLLTSSSSWHMRGRILPLLQGLYFNQLFLLEPSFAQTLLKHITAALQDTQVEVRLAAAKALTGLIQCSNQQALDQLQIDCLALINDNEPKKSKLNPTKLHQRHAGVLGLASIILAFPYQVPPWMPEVMVRLSRCLADPEPIKVSYDYYLCSLYLLVIIYSRQSVKHLLTLNVHIKIRGTRIVDSLTKIN